MNIEAQKFESLLPFARDADYEIVWRTMSLDEAKRLSALRWERSPANGELTFLSLGFMFPVGVSIDFVRRQILLNRAPSEFPLSEQRMVSIGTLLAGVFWSLSGRVSLHANAVSFDGHGVVGFTGISGRGKSTLTGYLLTRGAEFVSDDLLALDCDGTVVPSGESLKLWPESFRALGYEAPPKKRWKDRLSIAALGSRCVTRALPLTHLFLLDAWDDSSHIGASEITAALAPMCLMENGYFGALICPQVPALFNAYVELAAKISVYRLRYPRTSEALPEVRKLINGLIQNHDR